MKQNAMKRTLALLLAGLLCLALFAACKKSETTDGTTAAPTDGSQPDSTEPAEAPYDYLVLVNKANKLPDNWEDIVVLEDAQNTIPEGVELNKDNEYLATDVFKVETKALAAFRAMQADLAEDGIIILLDSTYRSVARQEELWAEFEKEKGIEYCQQYVAVPGYSEHHTGLAIDVCLIKDGVIINDNDQMIAEKEIFGKIHERLADYGFILRYPEGKEDITGFSFEPWHFRYVGVEAAKDITAQGLTLEEYLLLSDVHPSDGQ
ncbi:MAG: M15 family metallopeptidase [Clostridia bacterium]|nr:M15 family metallopeptidase [Clostridia bacterium]